MLTNSCVKLQTVHNIPLTINKEGEVTLLGAELRASTPSPSALSLWPVALPSEGMYVLVSAIVSPRSGQTGFLPRPLLGN